MHSEQGSRKEQPWRSELEIEMARQEELARHLAITPDIKQGVYPFRGIKLSRADVEWLVATHENAQSSQASSDEQQQHPQGLDLRGADLRYADLHALPLARLRGSLTREEWEDATEEQRAAAAVLLTGANLSEAHLEEADLSEAHLEKADLSEVHMEEYEAAVRANRQLAVALRAQGLDEEAARFAYRAQLLQRIVLRRQGKFGQYLFSLLLDLLAGYGYR